MPKLFQFNQRKLDLIGLYFPLKKSEMQKIADIEPRLAKSSFRQRL